MGVGNLKQIAEGMNREIDAQNELLSKMDTRVENATQQLENLNVTMKNSIEKVPFEKMMHSTITFVS